MSYLGFFDLHAEPFAHAPSDKFYYASEQHTEALNRLIHAVRSMQGLALLVGDIGRGKSTLARRLLNYLPDHEFEASMLVVVHAAVSADWLLRRIALNLGVTEPAEEKLALISQLYQRLVEIHASGKRAVVLVDEAQMLHTRQLMEEFRGLLNLEVPGHKLITFVFFGLPELEVNLRLDPPLAQRVVLKCALKALSLIDTQAYVQHRLALSGAERDIFPPDAMRAVHAQTQGVPRLINTLCDNVMLELFFAQQKLASAKLVNDVASNLSMDTTASSSAAVEHGPEGAATKAAAEASGASAMAFSGQVAARTLSDEADDIASLVAQEAQDDEVSGAPGWQGVQAAAPMLTTTRANVDIDDIPMTFDLPERTTPVAASAATPLSPPLVPAKPTAPAPSPPGVPMRGAAGARSKSSSNLLEEVDELLAEINKM